MTREERARVLHAGRALDQRLGEVAHLAEHAAGDREQRDVDPGEVVGEEQLEDRHAHERAREPAPRTGPGLLRRDRLVELGLAEEAPRKIAAGVGQPRDEQHDQHQVATARRGDAGELEDLQLGEERGQKARVDDAHHRRRGPRGNARDVPELEQVIEHRDHDREQQRGGPAAHHEAAEGGREVLRVERERRRIEPVEHQARDAAEHDRGLAVLRRQGHREELVHRDQRCDEDQRPGRLGPLDVEDAEQDRDRDDRDQEPLGEISECHGGEPRSDPRRLRAAPTSNRSGARAPRIARGSDTGARDGTPATARRRTRARRTRSPTT